MTSRLVSFRRKPPASFGRHRMTRYIGHTGHSRDTRVKKHCRHIQINRTDKSAVVVHRRHIHLHEHQRLLQQSTVREVTLFVVYSSNMDREHYFCPEKSWETLTFSLIDATKLPSQNYRDESLQDTESVLRLVPSILGLLRSSGFMCVIFPLPSVC
jgi:hypothetical protein